MNTDKEVKDESSALKSELYDWCNLWNKSIAIWNKTSPSQSNTQVEEAPEYPTESKKQ